MNEGWGLGMKWGEREWRGGGREERLNLRSLWNKLELPIITCPTHIFSSSQKELACSRLRPPCPPGPPSLNHHQENYLALGQSFQKTRIPNTTVNSPIGVGGKRKKSFRMRTAFSLCQILTHNPLQTEQCYFLFISFLLQYCFEYWISL